MNSSNQLVLMPKSIPTTSADTVPLSVQFEQIQAAARQQVLQQNPKYNITYRPSYIRSSTEVTACAVTLN